jgi:hypothetical protein
MRVTNIDTLSAYLDRLITERIKWYFFNKENKIEDREHQEIVIKEIKIKINELFSECFEKERYDYFKERRTYKPEDVVETLDELIQNDITTGEGDRDNLGEANSDNPSLENFVRNHKLIRKANEQRAVSKNKLDEQFKGYIEKNEHQ